MGDVKYYKPFLLVLICISLLSCKREKLFKVEYEKTFEEIRRLANAENKGFCIVLSDSECSPCQILHNSLYEKVGKVARGKAVFNFVDVSLPQNKWYQQFIASKDIPATLVFSPESELTGIILGSSVGSLECIKETLNDSKDCARYFYKSSFPESTKNESIVKSLNLILKAKVKLEQKEDASKELEESMNILYYPYVLWLQILNERNKGNEQYTISLAKQILSFQHSLHTSLYAALYADFYKEVRYIINPQFDIRNVPVLEIEKDSIDLGNCMIGEEIDIKVELKNTGKETLLIHDVLVSCSCIELLNEKQYTIEPEETDSLFLKFSADHPGNIERDIILTTNEMEPIRNIKVFARLKKIKPQ